ncbi:secondary thiamine-phosphate synthase enzyme YjbQ [Aliikangiella sp. IMCC44359]|uniref:secondary thiamine-phosphate synthase enzyme YjbQ n=1 Tax=Aliikangiella sp. IMCC44359 TaxID=3459125 RepID=UPI00403B37AF
MIKRLYINTDGQGLYEITPQVKKVFQQTTEKEGLCTLFVRHTSCSLIVQENADFSAKNDMESWLNRLVPENDPLYTHIYEGADDMPAHLKSILTSVQISIPFEKNELLLGTWQGVYLWEHRHAAHRREIILHTH